MTASEHACPAPNPESDAQFDEFQSWGGPAARISAAEGLANLARNVSCASQEVLDAVERLSKDLVPAIRFQSAIRLSSLYNTDQDRMWRIMDRFAAEESSRGVLAGLLHSSLARIASANAQRVAKLTRDILSRVTVGPGAEKVRESGLSIITGLYVWQGHALCLEILDSFVGNASANADVLGRIMFQLRDLVTHGRANPPDPAADAIRQRALGLVSQILGATKHELRILERSHAGVVFTSLAEAEQERVGNVLPPRHDSKGTLFRFGRICESRAEPASGRTRIKS